jgi:hypothetical protein
MKGTCARQLLLEVSTIRSMDVILPVKNRGQLRMRLVARPDKPVAELLAHLGLALPSQSITQISLSPACRKIVS